MRINKIHFCNNAKEPIINIFGHKFFDEIYCPHCPRSSFHDKQSVNCRPSKIDKVPKEEARGGAVFKQNRCLGAKKLLGELLGRRSQIIYYIYNIS